MSRHPRFDPELREKALAAYRKHGNYRDAAEEIDRSVKRTHELVREALRLEMKAAESTTTKGS
jgi:hypothetical protein